MEELEIMRAELASIKQKLDTQQIINKDLMRKIMRKNASWLNKLVVVEFIALPFVYLMIAGICAVFGVSQWIATIFLVFAIIDTIADWYTIRIPAPMFGEATILDLKRFLAKQKKWQIIQLCLSVPLTIIWVIAFIMAIFSSKPDIFSFAEPLPEEMKMASVIGGVIGGIIGAIVVCVIYLKIRSTNKKLLEDISDLEKED